MRRKRKRENGKVELEREKSHTSFQTILSSIHHFPSLSLHHSLYTVVPSFRKRDQDEGREKRRCVGKGKVRKKRVRKKERMKVREKSMN